jgi:hypothetical protein
LIILEGYSRTIFAGAMARTEATWAALMVLYTACVRYGVPHTLVSDSGGAYTSNDFAAVCPAIEAGLPHTQVLLWVSGEQWRAAFDNVILAEYHCRYDWRDRKVKDVRWGVLCPTRFASLQGTLIPLTPQDSVVVYHARLPRRRAPHLSSAQQWLLFEVVPAG